MTLTIGLQTALPAKASTAAAERDPADQSRVVARKLYLLPITDGQPTPERVRDIFRRLGRGGPDLRVGFSGVFRYMAEVDPTNDFQIVTTRLEEIVEAAHTTHAPFLVHLNGGRWGGGGPLLQRLAQNPSAMSWDQLNQPWSYLVDGEYHFSLASGNQAWRRYKERNLIAAATWLANFAAGPDGELLVGVSTDSEVILNLHPYFDYNPLAISEFADWLAGARLYGPGGRWEADGQHLSLRTINQRYSTNYHTWREVRPPRTNDGSRYWQDWTAFRGLLVAHSVQEQVDWIRQAGLPAERVFSHQSPALDPEVYGDGLGAAHVDGGGLGITLYGSQAVDTALLSQVRSLSSTWGVLEYNPGAAEVMDDLAALDLLRSYGPQVVCPYHWDDLGGPNEVGWTIVGSPLEAALRAFVRLYRAQPLPG